MRNFFQENLPSTLLRSPNLARGVPLEKEAVKLSLDSTCRVSCASYINTRFHTSILLEKSGPRSNQRSSITQKRHLHQSIIQKGGDHLTPQEQLRPSPSRVFHSPTWSRGRAKKSAKPSLLMAILICGADDGSRSSWSCEERREGGVYVHACKMTRAARLAPVIKLTVKNGGKRGNNGQTPVCASGRWREAEERTGKEQIVDTR